MSFRFGSDSTGNARVSRSGGAPDPQGGSGWTVCGWWYLSTDRNDFSTLIRLHASSGSTTRLNLATKSDGTTPAVFTSGNTGGVAGVDAFTAGAWLFVAVTQSGTTATIYTCTPGGTMHSASGTSSGGSAPDGYTIGGRSSSDSTEWFNGRARCVRQWAAVLTPTELAAERDSLTAIKASAYSDHPLATGTDLSDASGNSRTLTAGSVSGTTEADPPLGSSAADTLSGARVAGLPETAANGLILGDSIAAVRTAGGPDTAAVGLAAPDSLGSARAAGLPESVALGVVRGDQVSGVRTGALTDTPATGVSLPEQIGHARTASLLEVPAAGLVLADSLAGVRLAGLSEGVFTGQTVADTIDAARVGALIELPRGDLVLRDVIDAARVAAVAETASIGWALADQLAGVRTAGLLESVASPDLAAPDILGAVRIAGLAETAIGGTPSGPRDITVHARLLPSRFSARLLPSRIKVKEVG